MSELRAVIARYRELAGGYGRAVPLSAFGWGRARVESVFGIYDEDYQISRYLKFSNDRGESYQINGFPQTHVSVDAGIETLFQT